ncbi:MAG: hypothetical protein O3A03_04575 [Proteobacteria bacterium]|nr:hypothetical protein [Pseudomonadota bacterium]MDA0941997.1 hypothetical protein [Pseudomonadota bacterium]
MNKPVSLLLLIPLFLNAGTAWENSPNNWDNSPNNWENSPNNWENNPNNWENSPNNWDSDRVIRDNSGNPTGYAVPNSNGVINIYNLDGNREGYVPR